MRRLCSLLVCGAFFVILAAVPARARGAEPARVLLRAQPAADGTVRVTVTVMDARGAAVADVPVVIRARTTFGWLTLLETSTAKDGTAGTTLAAGTVPGEVAVEAGDEGTIRAAILVGERKDVPLRIRPGRDVLRGLSPQPGFISPYLVPLQVFFFGVILAGIWTTYGYVVWLLLRVRQERQA